ncbi:hypothetical protein PoB_003761000 [Plakobranchus ocellatus]|uniref:Uncharacterized protein n=1 Tax=Plakobranchus ocellatus TaxID=259542 RepID=A0AAV4AUY7_9GAST|nr:hypothetical protein PoB_003761000 [Plakobranchus ocellatus]
MNAKVKPDQRHQQFATTMPVQIPHQDTDRNVAEVRPPGTNTRLTGTRCQESGSKQEDTDKEIVIHIASLVTSNTWESVLF